MSVVGDDTSQNDSVSQVTIHKPIGDAASFRPTRNNIAIVTADKGHLTQLSSSDLNTDSLPSLGQRHQGTLAPVFPSKSVQYVSDSASSSPQSSACDAENGPEENPPALIPPHGEADDVCDSGRCRRSGSGGRGHPTSDVAEQRAERRMNRNGFERNGMTGSNVTTTSENLAWLASVGHATQATRTTQAVPHHRPPGGALLTTVAAAGGHHDPRFQHPAAVGAGVGLEALYRSGLAVTDPSARLYAQYSPAYTTTPTTLSPYPQSLYSTHGGQPMSPYAAYMYQWPAAAYSPGAGPLMPGQYPHIESFSAVLQNLGSQHAQHSHLPRPPSFVRPHVPHAPYPGSLTTTTDSLRAPAIVHRSAVRMAAPSTMEPPRKSPKRDQKGGFRSDAAAQHSPHDRKSPRRYSPVPSSPYRHPHHVSTTRDATYRDADPRHADPSAARKHRILTQSPQATADPTSAATYSPHHGGGMVSSQRSRSTAAVVTTASVGQPPPLLPSHSSSTLLPQSTSSSSRLPPLPSLHPADPTLPYPPHPHYPPHFMRGSVIQLANGQLKRVEELRTDDFISSADVSADLKIDSSTVVRIEENAARGTAILGFSVGNQRIQVTVEATLEHPFFVFGQGWSSCSPQRTMQRYSLQCHQLQVGDICISLTHKDTVTQPPSTTGRPHDSMISAVAPHGGACRQRSASAATRQTRSVGFEMPGHTPTHQRCWSAPGDIKSGGGDGRTIGGSTAARRVLTPGGDESAMKRGRARTPPP